MRDKTGLSNLTRSRIVTTMSAPYRRWTSTSCERAFSVTMVRFEIRTSSCTLRMWRTRSM